MYIDPTPFGANELSRTEMSSIQGGAAPGGVIAIVIVVAIPVPLAE
jgi:lactobin A/cerein 7B family class IIb bacteriocin